MISFEGNINPQRWGDVQPMLDERDSLLLPESYENYDRMMSPNGLGLRGMLEGVDTEELRLRLVEQDYIRLVWDEGRKPEDVRRILLYAARDLIAPHKVVRSMDRAASRLAFSKKNPGKDYDEEFDKVANPANHRKAHEATLRARHTLEPVRLGMPEIDRLIPGGIRAGEVLHYVGAEGSQKTSVLLYVLENYLDRGGKALLLSLDMKLAGLESRRLMRVLNCTQERADEHRRYNTPEYQDAVKELERHDDCLFIRYGPLTLSQIEGAVIASGADVVALDFVTAVEGFKSELDAVRAVSKAVRRWGQQWGTTTILLSQMGQEAKLRQANGINIGGAKGGASIAELADVEMELSKDAPLCEGDKPRLIANLRKNRKGVTGIFEIFPQFPGITFSSRAERVEVAKQAKPRFTVVIGRGGNS